jgi:hypothetical protein
MIPPAPLKREFSSSPFLRGIEGDLQIETQTGYLKIISMFFYRSKQKHNQNSENKVYSKKQKIWDIASILSLFALVDSQKVIDG